MNRERDFLVPLHKDKLQIIDTSKIKCDRKATDVTEIKSFAKAQYTHEEIQDQIHISELRPVRG